MHKIPVDVWVDAAHLIRHMQMTISATPASGQPMTIGLAMDFSDYGPQPRPAVPPADQVQDLSALAGA